MLSILPDWLSEKIKSNFAIEFVYEIRLRLNKPIAINYKGKFQNLCDRDGYSIISVIATIDLINYVLSISTKQSMYAYASQIKQCYISAPNGVRIGICGKVVYNNGEVSTIKDITSLNIRIPHQVPSCSEKIINLIAINDTVKNTLIISPPGAGKTTLVRDIVIKLSEEKKINNILVVDERDEIAISSNCTGYDIGNYVDVISGAEKSFAFNECLKTMNPSVIVTDEISKEEDLKSIMQAIKSGVSVIATAHAGSVNDLKFKPYFNSILESKYFERIVVLSKRNGVGTIECVYDENLRGIFLPYVL